LWQGVTPEHFAGFFKSLIGKEKYPDAEVFAPRVGCLNACVKYL
jgi:hypothetical protein